MFGGDAIDGTGDGDQRFLSMKQTWKMKTACYLSLSLRKWMPMTQSQKPRNYGTMCGLTVQIVENRAMPAYHARHVIGILGRDKSINQKKSRNPWNQEDQPMTGIR